MLEALVTICSFLVAVIGLGKSNQTSTNGLFGISQLGWILVGISAIGFGFSIYQSISKENELQKVTAEAVKMQLFIASLENRVQSLSAELAKIDVPRRTITTVTQIALKHEETKTITVFNNDRFTIQTDICNPTVQLDKDGGFYFLKSKQQRLMSYVETGDDGTNRVDSYFGAIEGWAAVKGTETSYTLSITRQPRSFWGDNASGPCTVKFTLETKER